jgi:indoleamine 2,3-dioxygenase
MNVIDIKDLATYQVDSIRGFLPKSDPLKQLPREYEAWEQIALRIPVLLSTGRLRTKLDQLATLDPGRLEGERQLQRALMLLSFLSSAYVWGGKEPAVAIPNGVASPLWIVAENLGQPPMLTYTSTALYNWSILDKNEPFELSNLAPLQLFLGERDEGWFYLVGPAIEARGASALTAIVEAQIAIADAQIDDLARCLKKIASTLTDMAEILSRIYEKCDPHYFYNRLRPLLAGWKAPGVVYKGVNETPQKFIGASAAQSSLLQAIDAGLSIKHYNKEARLFFLAMRRYMPPRHCSFIEAIEAGPSLREFALNHRQSHPMLCDLYNACIYAVERFRKKHIEIAADYISNQAPMTQEARGTGGSSFVSFLETGRLETRRHLINAYSLGTTWNL